jgi:hypothetical protein
MGWFIIVKRKEAEWIMQSKVLDLMMNISLKYGETLY